MRIAHLVIAATAAAALAACKSDSGGGSTGPKDLCPANSSASDPTRVSLAVGESRQLLDAASAQCVLLAPGANYLISVGNSSTAGEASGSPGTQGFSLVGASGGTASADVAASIAASPASLTPAELFGGDVDGSQLARLRRLRRGQSRMLDLNRSLMRDVRNPNAIWSARRAQQRKLGANLSITRATTPLTVGAVSEVRILNRDSVGGNSCSNVNYISIRARTVYVGVHSVVLEDSLAPNAATMDTAYKRLADEFDSQMYPILQQYYGDPLAYDSQLGGTGKIVMVFSPTINKFGDIAGFVLNCDLLPRDPVASQNYPGSPVSNEGEYFYAIVPDSSTSLVDWDREIRPTLIHEVKHVTSNAARFVNDAPELEDRWLEEATAVHAEEIWSRTQFGQQWKGNATYAQTLRCELRVTGGGLRSGCTPKPFVNFNTYELLYDYLKDNETRTPLGAVNDSDFVFYGAGWSLVRWAVDNYATDEAAFFKALTQATVSGTANLSARTGRPWPEMLADWSTAVYVDDLSGFTPSRPALTIESWNTRDIFNGMHTDVPTVFPRAFPLVPRTLTAGAFTQSVPSLRNGSFSMFTLTTATNSQIVELRATDATSAAPTSFVMEITRLP